MRALFIILALSWMAPMASTTAGPPKADETEPRYGYSPKDPIKVGNGPSGEKEYLNRLRGPNGERVKFERLGSCCPYPSANALIGDEVLLDMYEVRHRGLKNPVILYLNMYDYEEHEPPEGFVLAEK